MKVNIEKIIVLALQLCQVSPISDIWSNQAVFRVVDFFLHCLPISSLHSFRSRFFFCIFFARIAHDFNTFS